MFFARYCLFISLLTCLTVAASARAQGGGPTSIKPCDDFATLVLNDSWDMSNTADVPNFTSNDLAFLENTSFASGSFSFATTLAGGGTFRLLSPPLPSTQQVGGRWGTNTPIDTSKYTSLSIRMGLSQLDTGGGVRLVLSRGPDYVKFNSFTNMVQTRPGWATYTIDLNSVGIDPSSANTQPWSAGNIQGLGVLPSVLPQSVSVDSILLQDPNSCGSANIPYVVESSGSESLFSLYIDSDSDPYNGFFKKLVSAEQALGSATHAVSSLGLPSGSYRLVAARSSDYATLVRDDAWDMNGSADVRALGSVSNASYSGGVLTGTANSTGPQIHLRVDDATPISTSKFSKLSFKISPRVDVNLIWNGGGTTIYAATADPDGDGIYRFDLSGVSGWTGSTSQLIFVPQFTAGSSFSVDFVALRSAGYVTTDTLPIGTTVSNSFQVPAIPKVEILQPDMKGGEAFKPWNFRTSDVAFSLNLDLGSDPRYSTELKSSYLPDVRTVGGLRGDFFKGTNVAGNDDPNDYLFFPLFNVTHNFTMDASQYKNMCLKMMIDRDYDLTLGSVTKIVFKSDEVHEIDAWGTIYDRWSGSRWYEYCSDLTQHKGESGASDLWKGVLSYLRVDPHEFHRDSCCDSNGGLIGNPIQATYYYDYLKIRKDDVSRGKYAIVYDASDDDSDSLTTTFFYNAVKSTSGGTQISASALSCEGDVCVWDTSAVPNGTYYLYATTTDGANSNAQLATGRLQIQNGGSTDVAPILSVEAPKQGDTFCSSAQFKGFALMQDRFEDVSAVQVFVDGKFFARVATNKYSPAAVVSYPNADSSNVGFDEIHDLSGLSAGAHQVVFKAYSSDGGIASTEPISIVKAAGCADPAPVVDPDPAGRPVPAELLNQSEPGADIALQVTPSGGNIDFAVTGTRNCNLIRLGVKLPTNPTYTYVYGNSNSVEISNGTIIARSSGVPRFVGATVQPTPTPLPCKKFKKVKQCRYDKKKKKRVCKTIKKCVDRKRTARVTTDSSSRVQFVADCDQGAKTSAVKEIDARLVGCSDGVSCAHVPRMQTWFDYYVGSHKPQ